MDVKQTVLAHCQQAFPEWKDLSVADFDMDDPKGFSSFTMGVRSKPTTRPVRPAAALYRRLEGKENAILDFETERAVFLELGKAGIAAHCYAYTDDYRIEAFYQGRTLTPEDLFQPDILQGIAGQLHKFHQLRPKGLPDRGFFELIFENWTPLARHVLEERSDAFPANEQGMCQELQAIYDPETFELVRKIAPKGDLTFCHNDTYHGNIMLLEGGEVRLLDFEFSCLNHKAYDFSNLFAETVMVHGLVEYPYFRIDPPKFGDRELSVLINAYLDCETFLTPGDRQAEFDSLLRATQAALILSDFKYAMAAVTLAVEPIQKIRFIPYANARFQKFLQASRSFLSGR